MDEVLTTSEIAQRASTLLEAYDSAPMRIANAVQGVLYGQIMTCSLSHTLIEVFVACRPRIERVYVLEGRPRYEGRTMAQELARAAIAVTVLTDAQAAIFLPQCQCVAVGADSILEDGSVLNKAGTALLAWAAQGYGVPLYVLAETLKISPRRWSDDPIRFAEHQEWLEEKEASEVWAQAPTGIQVRNFYFDATPAYLIRGWFTEQGELTAREIVQQAQVVQTAINRLWA
jgi:translation initiation factor 2B subunit (eIF-2B alpha/beta/delta family)